MGRWHSVDPQAESYINESPYVYVGNRPLTMINPDGMAYRATKDRTGAYSGFEWVDDSKAYDKNGNLLDGYFEKAILFSDNNSWSIGTYQNGRYVSYNIGSATATVYDNEEATDENGNVTKSPISTSYEASTTPSDPNKFGTVKDNMLLQAVRHRHQGRYMALQLRTLSGSSRVPASDGYNPATGESYLTGANIHRDGRNNFTGTMAAQYQLIPGGTKSFFTGNSIYSIRTKKYSGVSEGCFLINGQQWSSFMNHFPLGVGRIGGINK